jgi:hypothetical protein
MVSPMPDIPFVPFDKIPRLSRGCWITEKIDGTNAVIQINPDDTILVGSRNQWITPESDNFGFARWVSANEVEIRKLGYGTHRGEWWGAGIQRRYGLKEKRFSLFNTHKWTPVTVPTCCHVVPVLYSGPFSTEVVDRILAELAEGGSVAAPGFMDPEGVIIFHSQSMSFFKKTLKDDGNPKSRMPEKVD